MLHARVIRPPEAGARLVRADVDAKLPGLVKVVRRGDFLAVACEREEQAIDAARRLAVEWSHPAAMFWNGYDALYAHLREGKPKATKEQGLVGDVDLALARAARVIEARYEYPFQSHASLGPACSVADVRDGSAVVWCGGQKPYPLRGALAELLGVAREKVRVVWMPPAVRHERRRRLRRRRRGVGGAWSPRAPAIHALKDGLGSQGRRRFACGRLWRPGETFAWDYRQRPGRARERHRRRRRRSPTADRRLQREEHRLAAVFRVTDSPARLGEPHDRLEPLDADGLRTGIGDRTDGTCASNRSSMKWRWPRMDPVAFRLRYLADARDRR